MYLLLFMIKTIFFLSAAVWTCWQPLLDLCWEKQAHRAPSLIKELKIIDLSVTQREEMRRKTDFFYSDYKHFSVFNPPFKTWDDPEKHTSLCRSQISVGDWMIPLDRGEGMWWSWHGSSMCWTCTGLIEVSAVRHTNSHKCPAWVSCEQLELPLAHTPVTLQTKQFSSFIHPCETHQGHSLCWKAATHINCCSSAGPP